MARYTFNFDIIVTSFELIDVDIKDPNQLEIETKFNGISIPIPSSQINVDTFPEEPSPTEIIAVPRDLRRNLEDCGLPMTVKYNKNILCIGEIFIPENIAMSISEEMQNVVIKETAPLLWGSKKIGKIDVECRLSRKELVLPKDTPCLRTVDTSINKEDILFLVGENQRPCNLPCDLSLRKWDLEIDDDRLKFGVMSFSHDADECPAITFLHNPLRNSVCCELKKMAMDCEHVVDTVNRLSGQSKPLQPPCRVPPPRDEPPCASAGRYNHIEIEEGKHHHRCFSCLPPLKDANNKGICPSGKPLTETQKMQLEAQRFCPVCFTDMTYLPKFAACHNCGVKPMPAIENECPPKQTPSQILENFVGKPLRSNPPCPEYCSPSQAALKGKKAIGCHCTCKFGKLCAYCRVLKICSSFHKIEKKTAPAPSEIDNSSEDCCEEYLKEKISRPFLSRVFSELCDFNNVNDTVKFTKQQQLEQKRLKGGSCQNLEEASHRKCAINSKTLHQNSRKRPIIGSISKSSRPILKPTKKAEKCEFPEELSELIKNLKSRLGCNHILVKKFIETIKQIPNNQHAKLARRNKKDNIPKPNSTGATLIRRKELIRNPANIDTQSEKADLKVQPNYRLKQNSDSAGPECRVPKKNKFGDERSKCYTEDAYGSHKYNYAYDALNVCQKFYTPNNCPKGARKSPTNTTKAVPSRMAKYYHKAIKGAALVARRAKEQLADKKWTSYQIYY